MTTKLIRSCVAAVAASLLAVGLHAASAVIGQPAPSFTLKDITGATRSLADFKGKTVVLEWVNPDCPFVKKHYKSGNIPGLQKAATSDGVVWLSINSSAPGKEGGDYDAARVAAWSSQTSAAPTAYLRDADGTVGKLYGAKTTPHIFVITPEGRLAYNGAIDSIQSTDVEDIAKAQNYVKTALTAVKKNQPVEPSSTQPYGCSVKY